MSVKIPVLIRVLRIMETSCPVPVNPRFVSSWFLNNAATILLRLLLAIFVITFRLTASLLIVGVSEYTVSQIFAISSVRAALRRIAVTVPL